MDRKTINKNSLELDLTKEQFFINNIIEKYDYFEDIRQ
mgnify:CR=1 FL=1